MVLCNNEIAIPAMQQLFMNGALKAVVVPQKNAALYSLLQPMLAGTGVTVSSVNKKNLETTISSLAAEKNITSAWLMTFSYIIPKSLLSLLPGGFINFHYGILPKYRGANPILAQMLQYETHSGLTIHIADENIDTGPIVMQQKIAIEDTDTFGIQCRKLGMLGATMAQQLLQLFIQNTDLTSVPQNESLANYFQKPTAADLMINWGTMSSTQVIRMVNACNPWNKGAGAVINNQVVCFTAAEMTTDTVKENNLPGTILSINNIEGLKIICCDSKVIRVTIIYLPDGFFPGYKLAGYGIKIKDRFIM
jgi:methionyl-tRNA formyltransferase